MKKFTDLLPGVIGHEMQEKHKTDDKQYLGFLILPRRLIDCAAIELVLTQCDGG